MTTNEPPLWLANVPDRILFGKGLVRWLEARNRRPSLLQIEAERTRRRPGRTSSRTRTTPRQATTETTTTTTEGAR